jgi:drug/metabolite transporter (DMT)-like permease
VICDHRFVVVAILAALAAGAVFAVGSVLQHGAAQSAPADAALSIRLLATLARHRRWLAGIGCDAFSFGLQALALSAGPIALVQPVLVAGVMLAVPLAAAGRGRRLQPREWLGTFAVVAGVAAFLGAAAPRAGEPHASTLGWLVVACATVGVLAAAVAVGRTQAGAVRASAYGVGAGAMFGLLAALTKTSTWLLGQGAGAFFTAWQPYAMAAVAVVGAIVQQSAYQAGPLAASVPVMDAVEPTSAVAIGIAAFGEQIARNAAAISVEVLAVGLVLAGIVALDRSAVRGLRTDEVRPDLVGIA